MRVGPATLARLDELARRARQTRSALVQRYVEEGVRMDEHPGIVFVDGPAGRRAALRRRPGLEVWEVIATVRASRSPRQAVEYLDLTSADIEVALAYYADHRDEIDQWIDSNREVSERAEAAWKRNRSLLK